MKMKYSVPFVFHCYCSLYARLKGCLRRGTRRHTIFKRKKIYRNYIYIYIYIYTHTYIYICVCVCACVYLHMYARACMSVLMLNSFQFFSTKDSGIPL